jgi:hypothetical protein
MKQSCPICRSSEIDILYQNNVPTLQNRVYVSELEAKQCAVGTVSLTHCNACNFTFNASFDDKIVIYDENYNNGVPSQIFIEYYQEISTYIYEKYGLQNGTVYDIGCGKGTFLHILCTMYPDVTGIGIDPSYVGSLQPKENLTFIQEFFDASQVKLHPDLILCRHVFEHLEFPKKFLEILRNPISKYENVPIFIEVPDFNWIVRNKTFWDLCYEHCNYFSEHSLQVMFNNPWSTLRSVNKSFGAQYLWVEGIFNSTQALLPPADLIQIKREQIVKFVDSISSSCANISEIIKEYKTNGSKIIVWGMATKGVIFTNNIDVDKVLIDFCVDINSDKQQKFAPISGHLIQSPEVLKSIEGKCLIIVMNANYISEIKESVKVLATQAFFIDAHGSAL